MCARAWQLTSSRQQYAVARPRRTAPCTPENKDVGGSGTCTDVYACLQSMGLVNAGRNVSDGPMNDDGEGGRAMEAAGPRVTVLHENLLRRQVYQVDYLSVVCASGPAIACCVHVQHASQ